MTLSAPPAASDSFRPATPSRPTLMPPPPERGSVPAWHLAADLRPLRPPPADLADSLAPRRRRPGANAVTRPLPAARRRDALAAAATVACALTLGGLFGVAVGQALRHRPAAHAAARPAAALAR
ncbi:MAG: hypothetical protein U0324_21800 [Polyangiales bacterium]